MMQANQGPLLRLDKISKFYRSRKALFKDRAPDVVALHQVSLDIARGEVFGLVGESGSGKTTCGRLIVGLERPDSGQIYLEGESILDLEGRARQEYRRRVQMVFQDPYQSLNPQLSVMDSVAEPLITNRVGDASQREEKVLAALKAVGLAPPEDFIYRYPHQLSGGQRQRVAIARAMILRPACLVADEPTSMLDASYSAQIFDIILGVRDAFKTTIIFITHSLAAARYLCDRIAVIYRGNLMELGPAQDVIQSPRHPYTQALLQATPKFGRCEGLPNYHTLLASPRPVAGTAGCAFFRRCRLAQTEKCAAEAPGWRQIAAGHLVACHFLPESPAAPPDADQCLLGA